MSRLILFEDWAYADLLPLTYWRSVFELRVGRKIMLDRIAHRQGTPISGIWARDWIAAVAGERCGLPVNRPADGQCVLVNGLWLAKGKFEFRPPPFVGLTAEGRIAYVSCDDALAKRLSAATLLDARTRADLGDSTPHGSVDAELIRYPWDLVRRNADVLRGDWDAAEDAGIIGDVQPSAVMVNHKLIHVGDQAVVKPLAVLDASDGPVYLGDKVIVEPHALVLGPTYVGPGTLVRSHATLRGGTSIGAVCKVGGEIDACIIAGYSNKQHEGFLGHAYVGNWVNIGALTTNSDLKNTYGPVRAMIDGREVDTGEMFFGATIADHVKLGIAQAIPTGASIGFAANVASSRILPKNVPSFAWLTDDGPVAGNVDKLLATAAKVMHRRHVALSEAETKLFHYIATLTLKK